MKAHFNPLKHIRRRPAQFAALAGVLVAPCLGFAQQPQIIIDDKRSFPESLTSTADGTIILGSLDHGTIYRAPKGSTKATPWIAAGPNGLERVLGVFAHDASNTLWVCTNTTDAQGKDATLKAFDLAGGTPKGSYPFPDGGLCNDIDVSRDGTVLATDTRGGRILSLKPGATALAVWAADAKWVGIDTAWVIETKFAYRNDPQFKDKDPEPFGATAVPLSPR
jgi:hypothetical protein